MKTREKKKLLKAPEDTTTMAKVAQISSFIDFAWKYK